MWQGKGCVMYREFLAILAVSLFCVQSSYIKTKNNFKKTKNLKSSSKKTSFFSSPAFNALRIRLQDIGVYSLPSLIWLYQFSAYLG